MPDGRRLNEINLKLHIMRKLIVLMALVLMSECGTAMAQAKSDSVSMEWLQKNVRKKKLNLFQSKIEIQTPIPGDVQSLRTWTATVLNGNDFRERMNRRLSQGYAWIPNDNFFSSLTFYFPPFTFNLKGILHDF